MISNANDLLKFFMDRLKGRDLIYRKFEPGLYIWSQFSSETLSCFALAKEQGAGRYSFMFCCHVLAIPPEVRAHEYHKMHIRILIERELDEEIRQIIDLEDQSYRDESREILMDSIVENYIIPALNFMRSIDGVRTMLRKQIVYRQHLTYQSVNHLLD